MNSKHAPIPSTSVRDRLYGEPFNFDFFQAVRLLNRLDPNRVPTGGWGPPEREAVRFRSLVSLSFPPSAVTDLTPLPGGSLVSEPPIPILTQSFFGLAGPSGVLPRHYTETLLRLEALRVPERHALREWFDLFNHRLLSLFHRAWGKYRFPVIFEGWGGIADVARPDPYSQCVLSLMGLGTPSLRQRLAISEPPPPPSSIELERPTSVSESAAAGDDLDPAPAFRTLAQVEDLALIHYACLLAHHPRNAIGLESLLSDYFEVSAQVVQHVGQWLSLEPSDRTRLTEQPHHNLLGSGAVLGECVWDIQAKIRVELGPLTYAQFVEFLPDPAPVSERKALFLLAHLVRLYAGQELDFEVELTLLGDEVPDCVLDETQAVGPRLGWNTWLHTEPVPHTCAVRFDGIEPITYVEPLEIPPSI